MKTVHIESREQMVNRMLNHAHKTGIPQFILDSLIEQSVFFHKSNLEIMLKWFYQDFIDWYNKEM